MRWANKVMSNNQDNSQSKLSNRSLSKFKKVNLQKSEVQISSNCHLQKSVLKLASVQKIKPSNFNRSYISNYVNFTHHQNSQNQSGKDKQSQASYMKLLNYEQQNKNMHSSKSQHAFHNKLMELCKPQDQKQIQGIGIFHKQLKKIESLEQKQQSPQNKEQNLPIQQKIKNVMLKLKGAFLQIKEISQSLKKQVNQSVSSAFIKFQTSLSTYINQFETNLQIGINQMINIINTKQTNFKFQNHVKTNQVLPPSPDNQSFYKIKYFQHQNKDTSQFQKQKQQSKNRPNTFKNKFKQMKDSSNQNFVTKNQVQKDFTNTQQQNNQKSVKKIIRKQTNPIPRVNSLLRNDSSVLNENSFNKGLNQSSNSIKYMKINDRSASKSVKKLHDKIILIKNIFNTTSASSDALKNEPINMLIQNK